LTSCKVMLICNKPTVPVTNKKMATPLSTESIKVGVASFGNPGCFSINSSMNFKSVALEESKILIEFKKNKEQSTRLTYAFTLIKSLNFAF